MRRAAAERQPAQVLDSRNWIEIQQKFYKNPTKITKNTEIRGQLLRCINFTPSKILKKLIMKENTQVGKKDSLHVDRKPLTTALSKIKPSSVVPVDKGIFYR